MNKYTIICICFRVFIPYHIVDYYIKTIDNMQNEMDFFYHCKKFEFNHDSEIFFRKIVYDTLGYNVLDSNVYLYMIDYLEFFLLVYLFD